MNPLHFLISTHSLSSNYYDRVQVWVTSSPKSRTVWVNTARMDDKSRLFTDDYVDPQFKVQRRLV